MTHSGVHITVNPSFLTERLIELGWEKMHVQKVYERIVALAEEDEDYIDLSRRLNPAKKVVMPPEPSFYRAHERAVRASPALDLELSVQVRDARNRLST